MIVGDAQVFAIESAITNAYKRLSLFGLGFFVVHVGGLRYGIYEREATMLANSLAEVKARIARRGQHTVQFATEPEAIRAQSTKRASSHQFHSCRANTRMDGRMLRRFTGLIKRVSGIQFAQARIGTRLLSTQKLFEERERDG